jgi:hypothetical protein
VTDDSASRPGRRDLSPFERALARYDHPEAEARSALVRALRFLDRVERGDHNRDNGLRAVDECVGSARRWLDRARGFDRRLVPLVPRGDETAARQRWWDQLDHAVAVDAYEAARDLLAQGWTGEAGQEAMGEYCVWVLTRVRDAIDFALDWLALEVGEAS